MTDKEHPHGKVFGLFRQLFHQVEHKNTATGESVSESASKLTNCEVALLILGGRKLRGKYFSDGLMGEPAWDIILDLYVAHCRGEAVDLSGACLASGVPATTALRYIDALYGWGLIDRRRDQNDQTHTPITISDHGLERIEAYLNAYSNWVVTLHRPPPDVEKGAP